MSITTTRTKTACPVEPGTLWVFNRGVIRKIRAKKSYKVPAPLTFKQ